MHIQLVAGKPFSYYIKRQILIMVYNNFYTGVAGDMKTISKALQGVKFKNTALKCSV